MKQQATTCQRGHDRAIHGTQQPYIHGTRWVCRICKYEAEKARIERRKQGLPPLSMRKEYCQNGHPMALTRVHRKGGTYCGQCASEGGRERANKFRIKKYGMTLEDYDRMLESQNFGCKICGTKDFGTHKGEPKRGHIDHCHITNKVRGILCNNCNSGLGFFKDNIDYLQAAMEYLKNCAVTKRE